MKDEPSILLIEDNPGDVRLIKEALLGSSIKASFSVFNDGLSATRFLDEVKEEPSQSLPHLILLDLNLPKKSGFEILQQIKCDEILKRIPVIVLSSSQSPDDIAKAYDLHANCYLTKPVEFEPFINIVKAVEYFWFQLAKLPISRKR